MDERDDPNTAVNRMLLALRALDYDGDFPANKLKAAYGEAVTHVLDFLTSKALDSQAFSFRTPKHSEADEVGEVEGDDEDEVDDDDIEDEIEVAEEEHPMFSAAAEDVMDLDNENHQIIDSNVDPIEWKTELERVGPRLRTNTGAVGKEWRSHIDQTRRHEVLIRNELPATEGTLKQINTQLGADVDKMRTKEKYVNSQFSQLASEYQEVKQALVAVESDHTAASSKVSALTQDVAVIADQLAEIKGTMDSRGSSMTDTTPLVKIRTALQDIKVEINHFELRIGVVGHTLLAAQTQSQAEDPAAGGAADDSLEEDEDFEV